MSEALKLIRPAPILVCIRVFGEEKGPEKALCRFLFHTVKFTTCHPLTRLYNLGGEMTPAEVGFSFICPRG